MKKQEYELIPYEIIDRAINGDVIALQYVVNYYKGYICTLSQKNLYDNAGNTYIGIDDEIKSILETKLIVAITNFELI